MTDAPAGAPATPAARPAAPARPPRRAPGDLNVSFANATSAALISTVLREPDWLTADRAGALNTFRLLPIESNVLYTTYVDLRSADLAAVQLAMPGINVGRGERPSAPSLPEGVSAIIEVDEGGLVGAVLGPDAESAGLVLESLAQFAERDPSAFQESILRDGALPHDDKLAQLTRTLWSTGIHVGLPRGARLERPIVLRWSLSAAVALFSRTLIDLAEDAEIKIVEELGGGAASDAIGLYAGTTEVHLGPSSNLSFASLQELSAAHVAFQHRTASIGQNAHLHWALAQLGTRLVRSRVDNRLEGDGSGVEQVEIVFGSDSQVFDLTSYTRHLGRDATSNLLSKAVLQDSARTYLKGLVTIDKRGIGTDSFLGEYAMNLSKKARAVAIPSLEIDQPDCRRVAHSSSVGPIDEAQLFYLESRGIPPEEARKFIVLGFLEPVVARVPLESARDRLREILEAKWDAAHEEPASAA